MSNRICPSGPIRRADLIELDTGFADRVFVWRLQPELTSILGIGNHRAERSGLPAELARASRVAGVASKSQPGEAQLCYGSQLLIWCFPGERILVKGLDIRRQYAALAKCIDPCLPVAPRVVRHQFAVRCDHGAQELTEFQIDRRTIVDCADADR